MISKRRLLEKSRLYVILDSGVALNKSVLSLAKELNKAGANIIQLRDKTATKKAVLKKALSLNKFLKNTSTIFIVNDYADIAKASGSDGLHIGQNDIPIKIARTILGKKKLIGVSCASLKQALKAQEEGADYIGVGPVFKTKTKTDAAPIGKELLKIISAKIKIPIFAIGNINQSNLKLIKENNIDRVAVCSAILNSKDIDKTIKYFLKELE